ncbi:hypothetical protein ES703_14690 [subsurface metagenome]
MNKPSTLDKGISDIVGVFSDPIISFPSPWNQDIPQWVKDRIVLERLIMNVRVLKGEEPTGTDAEALAYLMPASLEAPMGHDWTQIYLYIAARVCAAAGMEVPEDIRVEELSDDLMRDLNRLKAWIYQQRIKVRLERERSARRLEKEEKAERKKEAQPALFDF